MDADSQIIRRCQAGEAGAFCSLVGAYHSYAYALAIRMLWNEQDAEDVVQKSFLCVWNNIDRVLGLPHPLETIRSGALLSNLGRFRMPVGIPFLDLKRWKSG